MATPPRSHIGFSAVISNKVTLARRKIKVDFWIKQEPSELAEYWNNSGEWV
jgi:hypothetical protein